MTNQELFSKLVQTNVNEHTEQKNGLTYLSWSWGWQEFLKVEPDATYKVKMFKNEKGIDVPYTGDESIGYMVFTEVSTPNCTRECYLPVMDNNNNALKLNPYSYRVRKYEFNPKTNKKEFLGNYEEKFVDAINMFDVNKAIMRCLAKNLAMFGLGLYIYNGEDLPIELDEPATAEQLAEMRELNVNIPNVLKKFNLERIEDLTRKNANYVITAKKNASKGE